MFKKLLPWYLLALAVLSLAFIYGCGSNATGGGEGGTSGRPYYGMDSLGDTVKCTVTDTTFSIHFVSGTMEGTFSGNLTHPASGLLSAEVTSSSSPRISVGDGFYAYEITNEVLVVGGGPDDQGVIMICPALSNIQPLAGSYEAVTVPWSQWDGVPVAYMTIEAILPLYHFYFDGFTLDDVAIFISEEAGYSFTGGRLYKGDDFMQIFVSPKGMIAGTNGKVNGDWADGGTVGTMYDSTVSTTEIADGARTYKGIAFDRDTFDTDTKTNIKPLFVESTSSTKLTVCEMDPTTGAAVGDPMGTLEVVNMNTFNQGIIDALCDRQGDTVPGKVVAYKYASDKYVVCGFTTLETGALSFLVIEQ